MQTAHAGVWHLLGEVETVFGFWALLLLVFMAFAQGWEQASDYLDSRHFVEPMFVFAIMVMAASRPIMQLASDAVGVAARALPLPVGAATYFLSLSMVPMLGSSHHRAGGNDAGCIDAERQDLFARRVHSPQVRHDRCAVRQRVDRRNTHAFCGAAGADGRCQMGLEHRLRVHYVRLESQRSLC